MKKIFISLMLVVLFSIPAMASDSCESAKIWKLCEAVIQGETYYVVSKNNCNDITPPDFWERNKEDGLYKMKSFNESEVKACLLEQKTKSFNDAVKAAKWTEVK